MMCSQWQNPRRNEHHVSSLTQETPPQMKFPVVCQVCSQWCQCCLIQFLKVSVNESQIPEFFGKDLKPAIEGPGTGLRREPSPKSTTLVPNFQHHVNSESIDSRLQSLRTPQHWFPTSNTMWTQSQETPDCEACHLTTLLQLRVGYHTWFRAWAIDDDETLVNFIKQRTSKEGKEGTRSEDPSPSQRAKPNVSRLTRDQL